MENQIEEEIHSEKKADAYDPGLGDDVHPVDSDDVDVEQGRLKAFEGSKHQDVIPESVGPDFVRVEEVRRGLSQRHIQVGSIISFQPITPLPVHLKPEGGPGGGESEE